MTATKNNRYRTHTDGAGEPCEMSSVEIPAHVLDAGPVDPKAPADVPVAGVDYAQCPQCTRKVALTRLGYFEPHDETLRGGDRCVVSGVRYEHARKLADVPLPGDGLGASPVSKVRDSSTPAANRGITSPARTSTNAGADSSPAEPPPNSGVTAPETPTPANASEGSEIDWSKVGDLKHLESAPGASPSASTESSSPESPTTLPASPEPSSESEEEVSSLGTSFSRNFLQPASPWLQPARWMTTFLQPEEYEGPVKGEPMGELAKQIADQVKTLFYSHVNQMDRTRQTTMGPSEAGSPCDRRLGASLLGLKPVNPGGSGWAPFKGTAVHAALADMFEKADAGSGRFAVERRLKLNDPNVPHGTCDLIDRTMCLVIDHKVTGRYTLDKARRGELSETYLTQGQLYAYAAELAGEKIKDVAIIFWPMESSSLDGMHVHVEKYSRSKAKAALARIGKIAEKVKGGMSAYRELPAGDDCTWCPMHLKGVEGVREDGACGGS